MNTVKAQDLYNLREVTGFISGTDLHKLFYDVCDEPSPSGHMEIHVEDLAAFHNGRVALEILCRSLIDNLSDIASYVLPAYKVADVMAEAGVSFGGWVDWWGFKEESYDGCPYGFKIMYDAGVNIVINSDSPDEGRYLNLNAAKVLKYNDIPEEEVLKMITINPAKSLEMQDRVGSIEEGKDGDIAVFNKHPLDSTTKCIMTIIEGKIYFDYEKHSVSVKGVTHE